MGTVGYFKISRQRGSLCGTWHFFGKTHLLINLFWEKLECCFVTKSNYNSNIARSPSHLLCHVLAFSIFLTEMPVVNLKSPGLVSSCIIQSLPETPAAIYIQLSHHRGISSEEKLHHCERGRVAFFLRIVPLGRTGLGWMLWEVLLCHFRPGDNRPRAVVILPPWSSLPCGHPG